MFRYLSCNSAVSNRARSFVWMFANVCWATQTLALLVVGYNEKKSKNKTELPVFLPSRHMLSFQSRSRTDRKPNKNANTEELLWCFSPQWLAWRYNHMPCSRLRGSTDLTAIGSKESCLLIRWIHFFFLKMTIDVKHNRVISELRTSLNRFKCC